MNREKKETRPARWRRHHHVARDHDAVYGDTAARAQGAEKDAYGDAESERLVGAEFAFDLGDVDEVAQLAGGGRGAAESVDREVKLF